MSEDMREQMAQEATYQFLEALQAAMSRKGAGVEWQAEDELLEAASLIVRARLGRAGVKNPLGLARWRIGKALKAIKAEELTLALAVPEGTDHPAPDSRGICTCDTPIPAHDGPSSPAEDCPQHGDPAVLANIRTGPEETDGR